MCRDVRLGSRSAGGEARVGRFAAGLTVGLLAAALAAPVAAQPASNLVARAEAAVRADSPTGETELAALLAALRASHDADDQRSYVGAISTLGAADGSSPAAAKAYLRANAPGPLLDLARSRADWAVRGEALLALRSLDVPKPVMEQAIAIADADRSPQAGFLHNSADILRRWIASRPDEPADARGAAPADPGAERRALAYLRAHQLGVSYDALSRALGQADPQAVAAVLDAGVSVAGADAGRAAVAIENGLALACTQAEASADHIGQTLGLLAGRGFPLDTADELGNTLLLRTVQLCPAPVVARLLALGVKVDPVNKQDITPLQFAFVVGKWDAAALLVDGGARLTRAQADTLFFDPPQDPEQRSLLARATR